MDFFKRGGLSVSRIFEDIRTAALPTQRACTLALGRGYVTAPALLHYGYAAELLRSGVTPLEIGRAVAGGRASSIRCRSHSPSSSTVRRPISAFSSGVNISLLHKACRRSASLPICSSVAVVDITVSLPARNKNTLN